MRDEEERRVLYAQLSFHQKVLKSKSTHKEYFQLSKSIDGKVVKFTKDQMKNHLIEIIASNDLTSCSTEEENQSEARPVQYTERSLQVENYTVLKAKLAQKIEEGRIQRAVKQSKKYLSLLSDRPELLVNKHVKHRCNDPRGVAKWYNGFITELLTSGNMSVHSKLSDIKFRIRYEEDELDEDEPLEEEFGILVDLKNSDLIIVDKLK